MSDYDRQLKFIHGLQPWARKLIFRMPQLPDNLQDLMRMAERLGDDAVDKKEPGGEVRAAKVGKDNNSWQKCKKRKKDKHVHEKFEPKTNNVPKGRRPKAWEAHKPPKDKDACFGCDEKGHMKKDCSKVVSASTPRSYCWKMVSLLRRVCGSGVETLVRDSYFSKVKLMTNTFLCWLTKRQATRS